MGQEQAGGITWIVDPGDHDGLGPGHEPELTDLLLQAIPVGGVFLDVGAHVGHYALRAALTASLVYAIEPNPATAERLRENIALNNLLNVHVLQIAAWNGTGRFAIHKVHEQYVRDGSNRVLPNPEGEVYGARLDDALTSTRFVLPGRLDVVKIDTEGAEPQILDGMRGLIGKYQPVLFCEDHSPYGYYRQDELLGTLFSLGYATKRLQTDGQTYWRADPVRVPSTSAARL